MRYSTASSLFAFFATTTTTGCTNAFLLGNKPNSRRSFGAQRSPKSVLYQTHQEVEDYRDGIKRPSDKGPHDATDVVMKFGGSSLADASRVDHVANLIKDQIKVGYRPRAVVCSAMGKTTNALLSAGDFALGEYVVQSIWCTDVFF